MRKVVVVIVAVLVLTLLAAFLMSKPATIRVEPAVKAIGMNTPVPVVIDSPHGVRNLTAYVDQNGKRHKVFEQSQPSRWNTLFRGSELALTFAVQAGKQEAPALEDVKGTLVMEATRNDLAARS